MPSVGGLELADRRFGQMLAMALGLSQFGFVIAGGLWLGFWIDKKLGTTPWLGFLGIFAGFGVGIRLLMRMVRASRGLDS